jgi:L-arabinose isomerase
MTTSACAGLEVWFLTGSQALYGEETLRQVAEQSAGIAQVLDAAAQVPVKVVWKPVPLQNLSHVG